MNEYQQTYNQVLSQHDEAAQSTFINKVYLWMSTALLVTGFTALNVSSSETILSLIFSSKFVWYALLFAPIGLVWYISARIDHMNSSMATILFLFYAFINGLTLSVIFLVYTAASIASTFFITAGTFALMSAYGYFTKRDLTTWGNLLFMALIGLILASIVNIFWSNSTLYWIITYAGVLIFVGLTAYDTQKIKEMYWGLQGEEQSKKGAILGALTLYLDFINLFLFLLRIFGNRRD